MNYQNKTKEELIVELQKLRLGEEQKKAILNGITSNIAFVGPDLKIIWANTTAAESVHKTPGEMIGQTCHSFWADPSEPCKDCPSLLAFSSKKSENTIIRTPDGKVWEERGEPVFDEEGNMIGVVEIATDITERAHMEESLKMSELRLREVLENSLDASYKRNLRTNDYDYISPVFDQICGYTQDEMESMPLETVLELIHPDDKASVEHLIAESMTGAIGTANHLEYRFKQKDGQYRWLHDKFIVVRDTLNIPVAMIGSVSDVNDRRQAEELLRESAENLSITLQSIGDGVISTDASGIVVRMNSVAEKLCGTSFSEATGKPFIEIFNIINADTREPAANPIELVLETGKTVRLADRTILISKDEKEFLIAESAAPIKEKDDTITGAVIVFSDVTEKYLNEENLRRTSRQLQSIMESTGDVIAMMDTHYRYVLFNPAFHDEFKKIFGTDVKIGDPMPEVLAMLPNDLADAMKYWDRALGGEDFIVTQEFGNEKLERNWYELHFSPIRNNQGKVVNAIHIVHNVTDRKRAEVLLQQTRQNYESFFDTIDDFLFVLDAQGNIIHTNKTVIERLGYTFDELCGKSVLLVHPPERREEAGRIVGEMLSGVSKFCPVPIVTKSGVQIPVETRVSHGTWDGKPAIFGVTKDISAMRLSEEKFSKLFHLNPSACGLSGLENGIYYEVNEAFYSLFGFDKEEVIGKTASELGLLTNDSKNAIMVQADNSGNVTNAETDLKAKNGDIKHVLVSSENIFVQDKKFRFTVVHDFTLQKQIQESLRETSQKFEAIIAASPDGIGTLSLDGKIQLMSRKLSLMYGYSLQEADELIGCAIFNFIDPSCHKMLTENIGKLLKGEKEQNITEYLAIKKDNSRFYVDVNSTLLLDSNGNPESILFIERDITQRKQAEDEIHFKNQQLAKANTEKAKFFSIIAHDLRGPFNGFLGLTQLLDEELPSLSFSELQEISMRMRNSASNLFRLLENLLEWSRMQQGLISFNREIVHLLPIVHGSMSTVLEPARNKEIEIGYDIPEDLTIYGDINMLMAVIRNLATNAVKFTPKGGEIEISAKATDEDHIEFSMKDTGIGMSNTIVDNLFRLDAQTNRKGTEGEPSTGLGLIICKDFIEKHGGKIWVDSVEGKGSTFYFTLTNNKKL